MELEGWNSYLCNVNDEIASIFLNLDLKNKAPVKGLPKLSWYWIKLNDPKANGVRSDKEIDSLISHEHALDDYLEPFPQVYAGRITTQGRREFYFYVSREFDFPGTLKQFVGEDTTYLFQTGEKYDPD